MAPVQWMQRALPEATLMVQRKNRKGEIDELPDHLMLALIQNPNPHYGDIVLWWGYVLSMALDGHAYWMIVRNGLEIGRAHVCTPDTNAHLVCRPLIQT